MAFSFEEMSNAVATYPATFVDLEIVDVVTPGALNAGDRPSFRVKITNRGALELTGVTLKIKGLNGATVKQNGAAAPFVPEFVTVPSQLATVGAHAPRGTDSSQTTNGSPFSFEAPGSAQPSRNLVQVTLEDWNPTLNHILIGHSDPLPEGPPKGTYAAEVFPCVATGATVSSANTYGARHETDTQDHHVCASLRPSASRAGTVSAERPATIARTTWTLQTNRDVGTLVINTQGGPGAPGAANCRTIRGELGSNDVQIQGFYCPSTGRIHFVHKNLGNGNTVRVFTGNVSDNVPGQTLHMAGTMTVLFSEFGDLGEYNFSATTVE